MPTLLPPVGSSAPNSACPGPFGSPRGDLVATGVLSYVAGYVDAAGFLALFGLFTAHVTGDLVAAGTIFSGGGTTGISLRLATIPIFMVSVAATALVARGTRRHGHRPLTAILALMTLALAVFCVIGVVLQSRLGGPDHWAVVLTGAVGIFTMGIQNTLMRDVLSGLGPTTLMTGNLTRLTMDLVELALPDADGSQDGEPEIHRIEARQRIVKSATPILTFLFGTVLGGAATTMFGLWSIALPAATVGVLTIATWLRTRTRVALPRRTIELGVDHDSVMLGDAVR
jgi:uncharacterized membrane protein YoaK (UPF0700 family)